MKQLAILGAVAVMAVVITALFGAGTASADFLCTEEATPCGKGKGIAVIEASATAAVKFTNEAQTTTYSECSGSKLKMNVEFEGAGIRTGGKIASLTWTGCSATTQTLKNGSLAIEEEFLTINGELSLGETEVTVKSLFGDCVYSAGKETEAGVLLGGVNAKLIVQAVMTKVGGGIGCPGKAVAVGEYLITNHTAVYVHES